MKKFLLMLVAVGLLSCDCDREIKSDVVHLEHRDWAPDVKAALNDFMDAYGHSGGYAVFDFDNTSCIFDIEENQMYYQLENMCFEMSPGRLVEVISTDLTGSLYDDCVADINAAYGHLYSEYGPFSYRGIEGEALSRLRSDPMWEEFASKMCGLYSLIYRNASPTVAYNWTKYWCTGMTDEEVDDLSFRSHTACSSMETREGLWSGSAEIESRLGPREYHYMQGFRIPENTRELWNALMENGIDVWVCSASGMRQVLAAIDMFGLHDCCRGVLAMTIAKDSEGRYTNAYDYSGGCGFLALPGGGWKEDSYVMNAQTCGPGKVKAIINAIAPRYGGRGPIACFMDSTGDFNFCTEFQSTKLVVCFNRGIMGIRDGGGLIGETAIYERDVLGYDLRKAVGAGDIFYVLQGRNDNGMRSLRPSNATLCLGASEERLFAGEENYMQFEYMKENRMTVKEILEKFSIRTADYGFLESYDGYRSIEDWK